MEQNLTLISFYGHVLSIVRLVFTFLTEEEQLECTVMPGNV